jgi:hypothetical protein
MDWLTSSLRPYSCNLVNTAIRIRCTNLGTPDFGYSFTMATLLNFNSQLDSSRTMVIELLDPLPKNVGANAGYRLEFGLFNLVENIKKISPSLEMYSLSKNGLIHEENLNFGPVAYKPPITNVLGVSIYTDIFNLA